MSTWTCILLVIAGLIILAHVIAAAQVFYWAIWEDFKAWIDSLGGSKRKGTGC